MGISVAWDDEARMVLRLDFAAPWTWDDFDRAVDEGAALVAREGHKVHLISNPPPQASFSMGFPLRHFQRTAQKLPANVDRIVVVSLNPFLRRLNALFFRLYPDLGRKTTFVASLSEARAVLHDTHADGTSAAA